MRVSTVIFGLISIAGKVLAKPTLDHERVLVVMDDSNTDITVSGITDPLEQRGFKVTSTGIKDHPKLYEFGERLFDNVVIVPGRVKALGSTLKAVDILKFMELGGNVVALTSPKYTPAALREAAKQFGMDISGRGVQYQENFGYSLTYPHKNILSAGPDSDAEIGGGAAVAKLSDSNPLLLGLVQAPFTAYAWNAAKETSDDEVLGVVSDVFGEGSDLFLAAGLQSLKNARFVWLGSSHLMKDAALAKQITGWAFHEQGNLRLANVTHSNLQGESHLLYAVEQDLKYCADIQQWDPEAGVWGPYAGIRDVQLEFTMLDPYYRLNLGSDGCVEFKTPEQYGMFTFQLDYQRPGLSTIQDKKVVTIRHRAYNEWDRSWSISNSWVYLTGISTTVLGFLIFIVMFMVVDDENATQSKSTPVSTEKDVKAPEDIKLSQNSASEKKPVEKSATVKKAKSQRHK